METPERQVVAINQYLSTLSDNPTNSIMGSSDTMTNLLNDRIEPGQRDTQADIQYYTVKQGINRKTLIQPVVAPRITDQDHWGTNSTVRSDINKQTYRDITEQDLDIDDMVNAQDQTRRSLAIPQTYVHRTPEAVVPMNNINDPNPFGRYPGSYSDQYRQDYRDYKGQELARYKNKNNFPISTLNKQEMECKIPGLNRQLTVQQEMDPNETSCYYDTELRPSQEDPNKVEVKSNREEFMRRMYQNTYAHQDNTKMAEHYRPRTPPRREQASAPVPQQYQSMAPPAPQYSYPPQGQPNQQVYQGPPSAAGYSSFMNDAAMQNYFRNQGAQIVPPQNYYDVTGRVPPGVDVQATPVTDQLLEPSPAYVLTDKYFEQPQARLFLQDIQPKLYSYSVDPEPINANIGITYTPQEPPKVLNQLADSSIYSAYPLYSRIDPQLVRKDGTPGQKAMNPVRTSWSQDYSNFQPAPGTINFEDIYDPRFNSYGDPYRSYTDINLGQVQYYYSDVDAYRRPNFITRSNTDFIEYTTPNGSIIPYYNRTASLDDVRAQVENERTADELFFRQDLMSSQMSKANAQSWQQRFAPIRRTANSNMTFGPT